MEKLVTSELKLGVIAGGQLGKMLIQEASKWDIISYVLDNDETCPARNIANHYVKGSHLDYDAVYNFGKQVDLVTFEIESVNTDALFKLKEEGVRVVPDPAILKLIQDKGSQKEFYAQNDIPTSSFKLYSDKLEIKKALQSSEIQYPFVQKLRKGGYDGRGVSVINDEQDLNFLLEGPSVIEEKVRINKEIAVIVARNEKGEVKSFPAVEMVFDSEANLVEKLISPANIAKEEEKEAQQIAINIISKLNMRGLLAVELFIDTNGKILVNEVAPRPHNSGHHTIESIITSQYEQHLRAISNLPLGSTEIKLPSVMLNLLGEEGFEGNVKYEGLTESMAIEGVKVHLYGKKITKPNRKMGHITILAKTQEEALNKADKVKNQIKSKSMEQAQVSIVMGSDSDLPVMQQAAEMLEYFDIKYELDIVSAHRTPDKLYDFATNAHTRGIHVIIAGAGGAAHLPGMLAAMSPLPVIGVPVKSSNSIDGWDSVLSILQMPGGVPVATVALDGAKNAGILAAQIISAADLEIRKKLIEYKNSLKEKVHEKSEKIKK